MAKSKKILVMFSILLFPCICFGMSSTNYQIDWGVLNGGGGTRSSTDYILEDCSGVIAERGNSTNYIADIGYLLPYDNIILAIISSPEINANLTKTIEIIGSAGNTFLPDFSSYSLEYGVGNTPTNWTSIGRGRTPIANSVLGTLDSAANSLSGTYTLRLKVTDIYGSVKEITIPVKISNTLTRDFTKDGIIYDEWFMTSTKIRISKSSLPSAVKVYRWDASVAEDPVYYKFVVPTELLPGYSYWMKIPSGTDISAITDSLPDQTSETTVHLYPGWNQIACPFVYPVYWKDSYIRYGGSTLSLDQAYSQEVAGNYIYSYENYGYNQYLYPQGILFSGGTYGYFAYAYKECDLVIPPISYLSGTAPKARKKEAGKIKISAVCDKYNDEYNFIGIGEKEEAYEPPAFGNYVSLSFVKEGKRYANKVMEKASVNENELLTWDMQVSTNLEDKEVKIIWDGIEAIGSEKQIALYDKSVNAYIDMKKNRSYSYNSGKEKTREFQILVGKVIPQIAEPLADLSIHNYPNPDTIGHTTFKYSVGCGLSKVDIEIYNLAGELIDRFSGETDGDTVYLADHLANGVYIYRITVVDITGKSLSRTGKLVVMK